MAEDFSGQVSMTEMSRRQNESAATRGAVGKLVDGQPSVAVGGANGEAATAAPQSKGLVEGTRPACPVDIGISAGIPQQCSLTIGPTKAADPFFSGRTHYPALDGLRGIAIVLVLVTHFGSALPVTTPLFRAIHAVATGGWCGVDLFFVLSGFLITGILFDAKGRRSFFRNFYARRFLRIFPLYYGFLGVMFLVLLSLKFVSPASFAAGRYREMLWQIQPWLWSYTVNIYSGFGFGPQHRPLIVGQMWSLSVEEQFYLFWPLLVYWLPLRRLLGVLVGTVIGALALRLLLSGLGYPSSFTYMLTPCRADSLAVGALLALVIRHPPSVRRASACLPAAATVAGALSAVVLVVLPAAGELTPKWTLVVALNHFCQGRFGEDLLFTVLAVLFGATVGLVVSPHRPAPRLERVLSLAPLRAMGRYSYGIYVYHLPIFTAAFLYLAKYRFFAATRTSLLASLAFIGICFGVTMAASVASYHLYEKHFLKLKKYFPETTRPSRKSGA